MTTPAAAAAPPAAGAGERDPSSVPRLVRVWRSIPGRLVEGLLVAAPILATFWIVYWLYSFLEKYVIDPLAIFVLWKARNLQRAPELPYWFETFVAPVIGVFIALIILYCCGVFAHSRLRRAVDALLLRVPVVSHIYDALRNVLQCFDKPAGQPTPQRVVLVPFPHPGMRLPAIVTSSCRDVSTNKQLLCLYIPTTPIPTSGFFLITPEEDVTELNWDVQQTLQAIISGGLTAPKDISYYGNKLVAAIRPGLSPSESPAAP